MSYCEYVKSGRAEAHHVSYHDLEYGFPLEGDDALFERLVLEINQAGLSWDLILKRRPGMREAYAQFSLEAVANFGDQDVARLLADPRIIRNRLKVNAAIANARKILELSLTHGSFASWLDAQAGLDRAGWTRLFRETFRFTGGEIVNEFLMSTGYLPGAHDENCPTYGQILALHPRWVSFKG